MIMWAKKILAKLRDVVSSVCRNIAGIINKVLGKLQTTSPIVYRSIQLLLAIGLSIWMFLRLPLVMIGLATVPVVKVVKDSYLRVIVGFAMGSIGLYFLSNGIFWIGDVLVLLSTVNFLDIFHIWGQRIKEAAPVAA